MEEKVEELRKWFMYRDGRLYSSGERGRGRNKLFKGDEIPATPNKLGRASLSFNGKTYRYRTVVFAVCKGYIPKVIDHIDGNPLNNRIENLREASISENSMNRRKSPGRSSRFKGVHKTVRYNGTTRWVAQFKINGITNYLGTYKSEEEAKESYNKAARERFGEFFRDG